MRPRLRRPGFGGLVTARLGPVGGRDFGLLWLGRALSLVGDYTFRVAFATYVISVARSPATLAAATAALLVPSLLLYPIGGVVGDRSRSRRQVMIAADLLRFAAVAAIAFPVSQTRSVALVVLLALLVGVGDGFFQPAMFAFVTEVTPRERLVAANSALSVSQQVGLIVGPLLGGFLVALAGSQVAFGFDAASFLASAALLAAIRRRPGPGRGAAAGPMPVRGRAVQALADVAGGVRYVLAQRWLLISFVVGVAANAVFARTVDVSVPLIMSPNGVKGAASLGAFYTMEGVGALAGALILARLTITRVGRPLFGMLASMAASLLMVGVFGRNAGAYAMAVVFGVGMHFFNSLYPAMLQEKVPDALMSRVSSLVYLAFNGLMPLGALVMGPLALALSARGAAALTGAVIAVASLAATFAPSIRALTLAGQAEPQPPGR